MKVKFGLLGLGIALGLAVSIFGWQLLAGSYTYKGSEIDPPVKAADFALSDQNGNTYRLSEQQGEIVLLFFGYTHCPDVCPVTLSEYRRIKAVLGPEADDVQFVFITIDPDRDDQGTIQRYLQNFDPAFTGLTGSEEELESVYKSYGVYREKVETSGASGYLVDHSAFVYAIDRQGNWRLTYAFGTDTEDIVQDVAHLLMEE